jgi:hypothetical protein
MAVVFVLGLLMSLSAPLLRSRHRTAAVTLAAGAAILIAFAAFEIVHPDLRAGEAAVEESWRFAKLTLGCEVPVLTLALTSMPERRKVFWAGWIIHVGFTLWMIVVVVWLTFFWHW